MNVAKDPAIIKKAALMRRVYINHHAPVIYREAMQFGVAILGILWSIVVIEMKA